MLSPHLLEASLHTLSGGKENASDKSDVVAGAWAKTLSS
jgi:hypothetical protein